MSNNSSINRSNRPYPCPGCPTTAVSSCCTPIHRYFYLQKRSHSITEC